MHLLIVTAVSKLDSLCSQPLCPSFAFVWILLGRLSCDSKTGLMQECKGLDWRATPELIVSLLQKSNGCSEPIRLEEGI